MSKPLSMDLHSRALAAIDEAMSYWAAVVRFPARCSARRTSNSGVVSAARIAFMLRRRCSGVNGSGAADRLRSGADVIRVASRCRVWFGIRLRAPRSW